MCRQEYIKCLNKKCDGFAQLLALHPCLNRPNCQIEYLRLRGPRQSTPQSYCPACMSMTKDQRNKKLKKAWHAEHQKAKAKSVQAQEGGTNVVGVSAYVPVEQIAESSTMGASRGAIGGRFLPDFGNPFGQPSDLTATLLSQGPTDLVSGSDETMVDAAANEAEPSTNPFAGVTYDPQQTNPVAFAPGSNEGVQYFDPADNTVNFAPSRLNVPSAQQQGYQQLRSPPLTLEELIELANADQNTNEANLNLSTYLPLDMASPQFPEHPPSLSQIPIDSILLQMDADFFNGRIPITDPRDAEQFLRDAGVQPNSPDSKK